MFKKEKIIKIFFEGNFYLKLFLFERSLTEAIFLSFPKI